MILYGRFCGKSQDLLLYHAVQQRNYGTPTYILHVATSNFTVRKLKISTILWLDDKTIVSNCLYQQLEQASWASGNAFVSGAEDLGLKSRAGRIGHSVANGSPLLRHFFERSCVARAQ